MRILIIRHAEPDYSIDSLTEKGFTEREYLTERLLDMDIHDVYCSPLGRAKDTISEYIEKSGKELTILPWLHEFQGKILDAHGNCEICWDLMPDKIAKEKLSMSCNNWLDKFIYKNGNVAGYYEYVKDGLCNLLSEYGFTYADGLYKNDNLKDETIVLCCHFALGMVLINLLTGTPLPSLWQGFFLAPSSVTSIVTEEREKGIVNFRCEYVGDVSHLYKNNEPVSHSGMFAEVYDGIERQGALV